MHRTSVSLAIPVWEPQHRHLASLFASIGRDAHAHIHVVKVDAELSPVLESLIADSGLPGVRLLRNDARLGLVAKWNVTAAKARADLERLCLCNGPVHGEPSVVLFGHPGATPSSLGRLPRGVGLGSGACSGRVGVLGGARHREGPTSARLDDGPSVRRCTASVRPQSPRCVFENAVELVTRVHRDAC